jgi:preprotein translocase subunit Sss1
MKQAQLPDGTILEFPDDIPDEKMDFIVKQHLFGKKPEEPPTGEVRAEPPWYIRSLKPTLETAGLLGGGAVGTAAGPIGSVAGGGLGYAIGRQLSDRILEFLERKEAVTGKPPSTTSEAFKEAGSDIATGAAIQAGGEVAGPAATKAMQAMFGKMTPATEALIQTYKEYGIKPLPSEIAGQKKTLSILEGVLGYRPLSGDVFLKRSAQNLEKMVTARDQLIQKGLPAESLEEMTNAIKKEAQNILQRYIKASSEIIEKMSEDFMKKVGLETRFSAGAKLSTILESDRLARSQEVKKLYDNVYKKLPQKGWDEVPLSESTIRHAENTLKEEMAKVLSSRDTNLIKRLNDIISWGRGPKIKGVPEAAFINPEMIARNPELMNVIQESGQTNVPTWIGLDKTRSELLEEVRNIMIQGYGPTNKSRVLSEIAENLNEDMSSYAERLGGDVWKNFQAARSASRRLHELYTHDLLKIMNKSPEEIVDKLIGGGKEVTLLKDIRMATGDKGIEPLKQAFFKKLIDKSTSKEVFDPVKLRKLINNTDKDVINELATSEQLKMINRMAGMKQYFNVMQDKNKFVNFLGDISDANLNNVWRAIVRPENTEYIKMAKRLFSPENIERISSLTIENVLKASKGGYYLPVSSAGNFQSYNSVLKELLPADRYNKLRMFIGMGQNMRRVEDLARNASQTGQTLMGAETMLALIKSAEKGIATLDLQPFLESAVRLTGIPYLISKIYTSDAAIRSLQAAMRGDPTTKEAIGNFVKAIAMVSNKIIEDHPEYAKEKRDIVFEQ